MRLVSIESKSAKKLFWGIVLAFCLVAFVTLNQENPVLVAASFLVALIGLWPLYLWLLGASHGLPIWPGFCAYLGSLSVLPVLQGSVTIQSYSQDAVLVALGTVGGFLMLGSLVWISMTSGVQKPPKKVLMLESGTALRSLFWCLGAGLLFNANAMVNWFPLPGNTMQIARGIAGGLAYLGTFALAYFHGAGLLKKHQVALYLAMVVALVALSLTGLMLAPAVPFLALGLIGFSLGSGRLPTVGVFCVFFAFSVMHTGKYEMRNIYYNSDGAQRSLPSGIAGLPSFYSEWVSYGLQSLSGLRGITSTRREEEQPSSVFDRAGNLHNLLLVQDKSPSQVPFLNGITYEPIPMMLIPRFLAPDKAISHTGNILLSVNYGVVDTESARGVSIGWSLIAEAYANFGFLGVFILAVVISALYSYMTRLTTGVPITSFRFVAGLVVLAGITNENSLGVFITMQFQGVIGVALASIFLMRRQSNPYAGTNEGAEQRVAGSMDEGGGGQRNEERKGPVEDGAIGERLAADGGVVRTMPAETPRRMARWMPRRMKKQVLVPQRAVEAGGMLQEANGNGGGQSSRDRETSRAETPKRPRQLAVPFQNYRRYRT